MDTSRTLPQGWRIPSLDGLRAIAILCVLWHHLMLAIDSDNVWVQRVVAATPNGDFGVQIFFVLSGFLITTLLLRERAKTGKVSLRDFYRRRAYRIMPAVYVFLAVAGVLALIGAISLQPHVWVASVLFFRNYVPTDGSWWLGHMWTLAVEEQFYLLWPLAFIFVPRKHIMKALALAVAGIALARILTWLFIPELRGGVMIMFHTRADALLIGCMLAIIWDRPGFQDKLTKAIKQGAGWVAIAWMVASWSMGAHFAEGWRFTVGYLGDAIAIAVFMGWMILRPASVGGRVLNWGWARHIGFISFSLYLYQQFFLAALNTTFTGIPGVNLIFTFAAAELSYRLVEKPFLRMRDRRSKRSKDGGRGRSVVDISQGVSQEEAREKGLASASSAIR